MRFTSGIVRTDRYEYRIKGPNVYGKDVDDAIQACRNEMERQGVRSDFDDSVNVKPEDDDIVVWFEIRVPRAEPDPGIGHVTRAEAWDQGYAAGYRDVNSDDPGATTANPWRKS